MSYADIRRRLAGQRDLPEAPGQAEATPIPEHIRKHLWAIRQSVLDRIAEREGTTQPDPQQERNEP